MTALAVSPPFVCASYGLRARSRVSRKLPFGMIPAPMTGDDSIPDVAHLDATGSNGRITVFQVGYSTNMRFRWSVLLGKFSTTMI